MNVTRGAKGSNAASQPRHGRKAEWPDGMYTKSSSNTRYTTSYDAPFCNKIISRAMQHKVPELFPYAEARRLFIEPNIEKADLAAKIKFTKPDEEGLVQFLVHEKQFSEER